MMPKTWEDVEEAALHDAVLHQAVTLVERGDLTREEAMIGAALGLAAMCQRQHDKILELINTRPVAPVVLFDRLPIVGRQSLCTLCARSLAGATELVLVDDWYHRQCYDETVARAATADDAAAALQRRKAIMRPALLEACGE